MKKNIINNLFLGLFAVFITSLFFTFGNKKIVYASTEYTFITNTESWSTTPTKINSGDSVCIDDSTPAHRTFIKIDGELVSIPYASGGVYDDSITYTFTCDCKYVDYTIDDITVDFNLYLNFYTYHSVVYDLNDGEGVAPTTSESYALGDTISLDDGDDISKLGCIFVGWSTESSATTGNTGNYTLALSDIPDTNDDIVFYAVWESLEYSDDININISEILEYGTKKSNIDITVDDTSLEVSGFDLFYYDDNSGLYVSSTTVEKAGMYVFLIKIEGDTKPYYFLNTEISGNYYYSGDVTLSSNYDLLSYNISSVGASNCDLTDCVYYLGNASSIETENTYFACKITVYLDGYSVEYDDNTDDSIIEVPTDNNKYLINSPITISSNIPTRFGYTFIGWNTDENADEGLTFVDNKHTMGSEDITFYAIWKEIIVSEPSKTNDYEVSVYSALTNVSYKWHQLTKSNIIDIKDSTEVTLDLGTDNKDGTYTSGKLFSFSVIRFNPEASVDVTKLYVSFTCGGKEYIVQGIKGTGKGGNCVNISNPFGINEEFTISNVKIFKYNDEILSGETNAKLGSTTLEDKKYFVEVLVNGVSSAYSECIIPNKVSFKDESQKTTSLPNDLYQLDGRSVSISSSSAKTGYSFIGWNTNKDATEGLKFTDSKYTIDSSDIVFYAITAPITHTCDGVTYNIPLTSEFNGGILSSGNYYLYEDLLIENTITFDTGAVVNICLNGYVINCKLSKYVNFSTNPFTLFEIGDDVSLTITNCNNEREHLFNYNENAVDKEMPATLSTDGTNKVYGGLITGVIGSAILFKGTYEESSPSVKNTLSLTLKNVTFIGNLAHINGLIRNEYTTNYRTLVSIDSCLFIRNRISGSTSNVENNLKSMLSFGDVSHSDYGIDIKNTSFEYNYVDTYGDFYGLIGLYSNKSTTGDKITLNNVDFLNNSIKSHLTSVINGALIYFGYFESFEYDEEGEALNIINCDFKNNTVNASHYDDIVHGLVYTRSFMIVSNSVFDNNTLTANSYSNSKINGGMFYARNNLILKDTSILNNTLNVTSSRYNVCTGLVVSFPVTECYALILDNVAIKGNTVNTRPSMTSLINEANSGYYIFAGNNVKFNELIFENNTINVNPLSIEKVDGKQCENSNTFYGPFIMFSNTYVYGYELINDNILISNSSFKGNSFNSDTIGNMNMSLFGGILYFKHNAILENVSFLNNNVSTETYINGGLIYSEADLLIKAKETIDGNKTVYTNSVFDNNTITNTKPHNDLKGGLIFATKTTTIDHVDFTNNTVIIQNEENGYGMLIGNDSINKQSLIEMSNCLIKNNVLSSQSLNGIICGHYNIRDTEISYNKISSITISGGILSSNNSLVSIPYDKTSGIYNIDKVTIKNNEFSVINNSTSARAIGLIIYTRSPRMTITNLVVDGNKTTGDTNYLSVLGMVINFSSNIYANDSYAMNLDEITVTNNNISTTNLYGGFAYSIQKVSFYKNIKFNSNSFSVSKLYGGFINASNDRFTNLEVKNNTFDVKENNYANYFFLYESYDYALGDAGISTDIFFDGDIAFTNNSFTKSFADIVCSDDIVNDSFVKALNSTSKTSITSFTPLTYYTSYEIDTCITVFRNSENYFELGYLKLYNDKYYLDLDIDDIDKVIKIFNRFEANPSETNEYEYELNEKDTEIEYKWYATNGIKKVDLDINKSKADLSKYLYGTFYCVGTTKDGFEFVSKSILVSPTPIEEPSEDNGYKYIFDKEKIDLFDINVSYQWKTISEAKTDYLTILDDSAISAFNGIFEGIELDAFYNKSRNYWYSSPSRAICVQNVKINSNEKIILDISTAGISTDKMINVLVLFQEGDAVVDYGHIIDSQNSLVDACYTIDYIYPYSPSDGNHEYGEELTYIILIATFDINTNDIFDTEVIVSKYNPIDEDNNFKSDDIEVFDDSYLKTTYDENTNIFTQDEESMFAAFEVKLEKDDVIVFEYLIDNYDEIYWNYLNGYVFRFDEKISAIPDELDNPVLEITSNDSFRFNSYKALEDGYYLFAFSLYDENQKIIPFEGKIHLGGYPYYKSISGYEENELSNIEDGEYLCTATFSSENFGLSSVNSSLINYVTRGITYIANGENITVPTDTNTYKNIQKFTILGNENDLVVLNKTFKGWSTTQDGSGTLYQINDTVTMGKEAVSLYAIYDDKISVVLNKTSYTYTYDGSSHAFEIDGNVSDNFKVSYYDGKDWSNNAPINSLTYKVKVTREEDSTYSSFEAIYDSGLVINKATTTIDKSGVTTTYTYNGSLQSVTSGATLDHTETTLSYTDNTFTNAGTYTVTISAVETSNYKSASTTVEVTVIKAISYITVDTRAITKTYGEEVILPEATALFDATIACDKQASDLVNAGTYIVTYTVDSTSNYDGDTKTLTVVINKVKVNEPAASKAYIYNGENQVAVLNGYDESYMFKTGTYSATEPGIYTLNISLDDNHEWADGSDGIVTWEIKATSITPKQKDGEEKKQNVVVETEEGFDSNITVEVEVTTESSVLEQIEKNELTIDYYKAIEEDEKVGVVFDVKLYRITEQGKEEINVSSLGENVKIKVKMLIPEDVDQTKLTRILHVHNDGTITEYKFDLNNFDEDGFYVIEIDKLSEFAFIYRVEKQNTSTVWIVVIVSIIVLFLLLFVIMFILWKHEFDHTSIDNIDSRKLLIFDPIYRPINKLLFGGKK